MLVDILAADRLFFEYSLGQACDGLSLGVSKSSQKEVRKKVTDAGVDIIDASSVSE